MFKNKIKLFKTQKIRTIWNENDEKYYFSIVDIIRLLSESKNPRRYWTDLKRKLKNDEKSQVHNNILSLKMLAPEGKMRLTDVADTKQLLRIIQSIPSPNAEPFKIWFAELANDRLKEIANPELIFERAIETYRSKGYSEEWISQKLKSIERGKDLTDEFNKSEVKKGVEYRILTDEIKNAGSGKTTKKYKKFKSFRKERLRNNMTNMELVLKMLAEVSTSEISKSLNPKTFNENKELVKKGDVAGVACNELEKRTNKK